MDYEKLGLFYLGRKVDPETHKTVDEPILYDSSDLVTHGVILGMTGSGKTGLGIDLIEEAAIDNVPVIAIDPKGDLPNLLLTFPDLTAAEFAPWVNLDEARAAGLAPDAFAANEAERWKKGLAEWGQDGERITRLRAAADVALYTPGSTMGRSLSIVKSFAAPPAAIAGDAELLAERVSTAATSILTLAGIDATPLQSREHILISTLLGEAWRNGRDLDLASLIGQAQSPPIAKVGVLDLESFFPSGDRFALAMRLNNILAAPGFSAWMQGEPLDIDRLLFTAEGKARVSVISIAHLNDHERMFFVSLFLNELVGWMRAQRGTSSLRALVYFDEIFGFLPPVANPPSKAPLLLLLKQARAFGLGLTLATQNPVDLDYKALSNAGTWMIGRLQTDRDKARLLDGLEGVAASAGEGFDRARLDSLISSLAKRVFLLHNVHEKEPLLFQTRWTMSYLRGPLGREEMKKLAPPPADSRQPTADTHPPTADSRRPTADSQQQPSQRPVLDPAIPQYFAPGAGTTWVPAILGSARIAYADAKLGLDETRDVIVTTPLTDQAVAVDWEHAEPADFTIADLARAPGDDSLTFSAMPADASKPKSYARWTKEFERWAGRTQAIELFRHARAKITSNPDESERDFRIRVQHALREARDAAVAKVREKYTSKVATLEDRIRRAAQATEQQAQQASESKLQVGISMATTVFGALLGRKAVSLSTLGRATTAARGVGRASREADDVARAKATEESLTAQRDALAADIERDVAAVSAEWDRSADDIERLLAKPKRGGVSVQLVALVWLPQ
jgi:hypothetical protein